jgi:hypothetical protein
MDLRKAMMTVINLCSCFDFVEEVERSINIFMGAFSKHFLATYSTRTIVLRIRPKKHPFCCMQLSESLNKQYIRKTLLVVPLDSIQHTS